MEKRAFFKEPVEPVNLLANLFAGSNVHADDASDGGGDSTPPPQGGARQVARKEPQQARRDAQKQAQPAAAAAQKKKKTPGARGKNWTYPEKLCGVYAVTAVNAQFCDGSPQKERYVHYNAVYG